MPDFLLRPTEERDLASITDIYADAVLTSPASYELVPPDLEEMTRRWENLRLQGYPHIVAVSGETVLGYSHASPFRPRPGYRFSVEDSVYVARPARRGGIGRALLSEIIRLAETRGYRQMIAVIGGGSEHPASEGLHRALGFRRIGVIEASGFKHGRWLDTLFMQRALGPGSATPPDGG